jgi:hypothetical protein
MVNKRDFNIKVMHEIGLEVDKNNNIVDQDTGNTLTFKDKTIKYENANTRRDEVQFDPLSNPPMMNSLFDYYLNKIEGEGKYVKEYHKSNNEKGEKGYIELKENKQNIRSGSYYNDSVKYADLILKINESKDDINLPAFDTPPVPNQGGRKNGTK